MQGRLRGEPLSVVIETQCGHCGEAITFEMDSEHGYEITEGGDNPLVFHPFVDFSKLTDPSIIDAF